jgi:hypothetical protein
MENTKIVEGFLQAIEKNDFVKAESFVSKDFKVMGVSPDPLGTKEFLGAHRALGIGMPDFKFNYKIEREKNNVVDMKVKLTGTQTHELPAPIPGLKNIPATNKFLKMPEEPLQVTIRDNKIAVINLKQVPGGGLPGILKQLGVELPAEVLSH